MIYTIFQLFFNPIDWLLIKGLISSPVAIYIWLVLGLYFILSIKFAFFHWKVTRG